MSGFENDRTYGEILAIVAGNGGRIDNRTFARRRWPHSPLWSRQARQAGPGGHREVGAPLHSAAAGLLGRVAWQGLLCRIDRGVYEITERGRHFLALGGVAGASTATKPTAAAIVAGGSGWVLAADARWYSARILQVLGDYALVAFANGAQQWVDVRVVVVG